MRILHFSDPHVGMPLYKIFFCKWFGKRAIGGANLLAGRRHLFASAPEKLAALAQFKEEQQVDLVICTGDYTALGLELEYIAARQAIEPLLNAPLGYMSVPGNHDLYTGNVLRKGRFSVFFGDTLHTALPEYQVDDVWPLVHFAGDQLAVIAVNSSRPNPMPWRSSGRIPEIQLQALAAMLRDPRLASRFVFIITHYAPLRADSRLDSKLHGLLNAREFLTVCALAPNAVILCGHIHKGYHVTVPGNGQSIYCAGSVSMAGRERFWLFDYDGNSQAIQARSGRWAGKEYVLA
jgi:3',5'-cyclic AMP phosphodiesterase CpdA